MLTTTHLAAVVLIGLLLNMNRDEWFVAITFGVLIDADHLFAAPRYISDNGLGAIIKPSWDDASGLPWRSLFHEPVGAFFVVPLAIGWRYMIPFVFWGVHVAADELQNATLEYSVIVESALFVFLVTGIFYVTYARWRALDDEPSFQKFMTRSWVQIRAWLSGFGSTNRAP